MCSNNEAIVNKFVDFKGNKIKTVIIRVWIIIFHSSMEAECDQISQLNKDKDRYFEMGFVWT